MPDESSGTEYRLLVGVNVPPGDTRYEAGTVVSSTAFSEEDLAWMLRDGILQEPVDEPDEPVEATIEETT